MSGEVYDIYKQTIYIAPKSKIESRAHYAPKPARGLKSSENFKLTRKPSLNVVLTTLSTCSSDDRESHLDIVKVGHLYATCNAVRAN